MFYFRHFYYIIRLIIWVIFCKWKWNENFSFQNMNSEKDMVIIVATPNLIKRRQYKTTKCLGGNSANVCWTWRRLQDVSWRRLEDMSWRCLEDMSSRILEDIMEAKQNSYWGYLYLTNLNAYLTNLYLANLYLTFLRWIQNALIRTQ